MSIEGTSVARDRTLVVSGEVVTGVKNLPPMPPHAVQILREVAALHGLSPFVMITPRKLRPIVYARQHFMARCVDECGYSLARIGRWLSRDHSTVKHGVAQFRKRFAKGVIVAIPRKKNEPQRARAILTDEERRAVRAESLRKSRAARSEMYGHRRARAYALSADGVGIQAIAERVGVHPQTVWVWLSQHRKALEAAKNA